MIDPAPVSVVSSVPIEVVGSMTCDPSCSVILDSTQLDLITAGLALVVFLLAAHLVSAWGRRG